MILITFIYALLSGLVPALLWLWFWLREDNIHPEPKRMIAAAFIAGGLSVIAAIVFEKYVMDITSEGVLRYTLWAVIEEVSKFIAVAIIAFRPGGADEPIDMMIYCITVSLGFAGLENALFLITPLNSGEFAVSVVTGNLRFIGATLVHVVSSAWVGFLLAISFYRRKSLKIYYGMAGIVIAVALHAVFNLAIINATPTGTLRIFGWVWIAVIVLIILFEEVKAVHA